MITAKEARQYSVDALKQANTLSEETVGNLLATIDAKVIEAAKRGSLETSISLEPINRLNDINVEAAKRSVYLLSGHLERLGYRNTPYTNFTSQITLYWDR